MKTVTKAMPSGIYIVILLRVGIDCYLIVFVCDEELYTCTPATIT